MLYLVGLGMNPKQITLEALDALKACGEIFIEGYTSRYAEGSIGDLEKLIGKKIRQLGREAVETGFGKKITEAKKKNIALAAFGDALSATTHVQLLLDAKKAGVEFKVVHGISIFDALAESGLDRYKFGRTCTVVQPQKGYAPDSFYDIIAANSSLGLHTLCLLDIAEKGKLMGVAEALEILGGIEKRRGTNILRNSTLVAIAGAGSSVQVIKKGGIGQMKSFSPAAFPQCIVVCGKLNEKEKEALGVLA